MFHNSSFTKYESTKIKFSKLLHFKIRIAFLFFNFYSLCLLLFIFSLYIFETKNRKFQNSGILKLTIPLLKIKFRDRVIVAIFKTQF